jgi:hypothetical protein
MVSHDYTMRLVLRAIYGTRILRGKRKAPAENPPARKRSFVLVLVSFS